MRKTFFIILIILILTGGVIGYYSKTAIPPISQQLDLKSGSTHIHWVIGSSSYCDTTRGSCQNYSSSSSTSSSWGGSSGGGGK